MASKTLPVVIGLLVIGAAAGGSWYWRYRSSPAYAVTAAHRAMQGGNRLAFERYVDVGRLTDQVVEEFVKSAMRESPAQGSSENPWSALGTTFGAALAERMKPMLADQFRTVLAHSFDRDSGTAEGQSGEGGLEGAAHRLFGDSARMEGFGKTQREGNIALVEVRVRRSSPDSVLGAVLRLEKTADDWRIVGVDNLADILRPMRAEAEQSTRARAIVAGMRSDLRNLVTAQEAFWSDNSDYAGEPVMSSQVNGRGGAGKLTFAASTGNAIALTYVSKEGWKATVTHPESPMTCGIFVGPPANSPNAAVTQEGAPACW